MNIKEFGTIIGLTGIAVAVGNAFILHLPNLTIIGGVVLVVGLIATKVSS
jgi:hypothetical protein